VLQEIHSGIGGGHFGINKTLNKVRPLFERIAVDVTGPFPKTNFGI